MPRRAAPARAPASSRCASSASVGHQVERAEAARIDEARRASRRRSPASECSCAHRRRPCRWRDQHAAGHAEMDQQRSRRRRGASACIWRAAGSRAPAPRSAAPRAPSRQRPAQIRPARSRHARIARPCKPRRQAAHHGLDLGEFRHGAGSGYTGRRMSDNPAAGDTSISASARSPRGEEARAGARGVRQRGAALRPDERPDVARRPPRLEAHLRHRAEPAAAAARCSISPAAPATSRSAGWRAAAARRSCPTSTRRC